MSNKNGVYDLHLNDDESSTTVTVEASGYVEQTIQLTVEPEERLYHDFTLQVKGGPSGPPPEDTPIRLIKLPKTEIESAHSEPIIMQIMEIEVPEGGAELYELTISSSGTGDESTGIQFTRLFHDVNKNNDVDLADYQIGTDHTFDSDNGSITFKPDIPYALEAGLQRIVVTYDRRAQ